MRWRRLPRLATLMRLKVVTALAIAEYFPQAGLNVLLLMDSLTRYAQAQRGDRPGGGELPAVRAIRPRCL